MNYFLAREQCLLRTADGGFVNVACLVFLIPGWLQSCKLDRFLTEFEFELKRHLQGRVQGFLFFEFKFEFGKMIEFEFKFTALFKISLKQT